MGDNNSREGLPRDWLLQVSLDGRRQSTARPCGRDRWTVVLPLSRGRFGSIVPGYRRRTAEPVSNIVQPDEHCAEREVPQNQDRAAEVKWLSDPCTARLLCAAKCRRCVGESSTAKTSRDKSNP